ncbi:MAG TPA: TlpA disulfide reductase family protein [Bryobacteraceae bacterium]|nr:TlpA disulfide reductase family protein [Bryobacteraceae bacterium]
MTHSKVDQALKVLIGGLLVALAALIVYTMQDHVVAVGDSAPNFTITTADGKKVSPADFRGKVLVLNFWASWCPPCVQEAPSLNEFAKTLAPSGVVVLAVSVDKNEQQYRDFLKKFQVSFLTARDPAQDSTYRYGTYQFPESYIIDRNGKVVRKFAGLPDDNGRPIPWTDPSLISFVKSLAS